jgi:hypothetical protein
MRATAVDGAAEVPASPDAPEVPATPAGATPLAVALCARAAGVPVPLPEQADGATTTAGATITHKQTAIVLIAAQANCALRERQKVGASGVTAG